MKTTSDSMTAAEAIASSPIEASADLRVWQEKKIRAGLRDADAGRFATPEQVRTLVQRYIPSG